MPPWSPPQSDFHLSPAPTIKNTQNDKDVSFGTVIPVSVSTMSTSLNPRCLVWLILTYFKEDLQLSDIIGPAEREEGPEEGNGSGCCPTGGPEVPVVA